jgi:SAM-dependent methyltransferase
VLKIENIYSLWKTKGPGGFIGAVFQRLLRKHLPCFRLCRPFLKGKIGLEIGGPSGIFKAGSVFPAYALPSRIDNCNFCGQTVWEGSLKEGDNFFYDKNHKPGHQYITEATDLHRLVSGAYDFVLSSHTLEHVANPLLALSEWVRVLKEDGLIVVVVPHKDGTFDHRRPTTTLMHLREDFEKNTSENDLTHLDEILKYHDLSQDPDAGSLDSFEDRSKKNLSNRCLHHHVFDTRLAIDVINQINLQILAVETFRPYHIMIVAQKPKQGQTIRNDPFHLTPGLRSPFPTDQTHGKARA